MVGVVLLLLGACATPNLTEQEDPLQLPDRADPPDPIDAARPPVDAERPDASLVDAPIDSADAAPVGLRVFVTSTSGNSNFGGVAGGDTICTNLAIAAKLGGTWAAWLSVENGPHASDRVTSTGPWRLVSGEMVALTKAELLSGTLRHAIDHDEKGIAVPATRAWTGTGPGGQYSTNDCDKWTNGTNGRVGATDALDANWTSTNVDDCGNSRRLYCFQR